MGDSTKGVLLGGLTLPGVVGPGGVHLTNKMRRKYSRAAAERRAPSPIGGEIKARMREAVEKRLARHVEASRRSDPFLNLFDYWSFRRFGIDALSPVVRRWIDDGRGGSLWLGADIDGEPILCAPEESIAWQWWVNLHWQIRLGLSGWAPWILGGLQPAQEAESYNMRLDNPNFEIDGGDQNEDVYGDTLPLRV